ncbi:hypothetical protein P3T73_03505 [Kiritimatiellota bacterium B12222]|nr:hypothetical protein P3T73_03505 [Kiritimatiellota bacterium B12222]
MNTDKSKDESTFESEVLSALAYEWNFSDQSEIERKIKRRLRDKKLGPYNQSRVDTLRTFKNDVQTEINPYGKSKFYLGTKGSFADMAGWNLKAVISHFQKRHPTIPNDTIERCIPFAIFVYYLK